MFVFPWRRALTDSTPRLEHRQHERDEQGGRRDDRREYQVAHRDEAGSPAANRLPCSAASITPGRNATRTSVVSTMLIATTSSAPVPTWCRCLEQCRWRGRPVRS